MERSEFQKQHMCNFRIDPREQRLIDRLNQYYDETPDSMSNQAAIQFWREFKRWCEANYYTREEVNRAKRSIRK